MAGTLPGHAKASMGEGKVQTTNWQTSCQAAKAVVACNR